MTDTFRRTIAGAALALSAASVAVGCAPGDADKDPATVTTTSAINWACGTPGASEVIVYQGADFTGTCRKLGIGSYPNPADFSPVPNDSISSVWVGSGVRAVLYDYAPLSSGGKGQADYEPGPYTGADLGPYVAGRTSSILVQSTLGNRIPAKFVGDWPSDRANFWSGDAQGIAHSADAWFLTRNYYWQSTDASGHPTATRTGIIYKLPLTTDLASSGNGYDPSMGNAPRPPSCPECRYAVLPSYVRAMGYNHFGDPDVYGANVYVPVEGPGQRPIVAVFRLQDLAFMSYATLTAADSSNQCAWLAITSDGILYTSGDLTATGGVYRYRINTRNLANGFPFLSYLDMPWLFKRRNGTPVDVHTIQGGDLSPDNKLLYLTNGCHSCGGGGADGYAVYAFDVAGDAGNGFLQARSENNYGPFNYQLNPDALAYQEPEGVDYFDVAGVGAPNIPTGQLHVMLYSNTSGAVWLKHYFIWSQ